MAETRRLPNTSRELRTPPETSAPESVRTTPTSTASPSEAEKGETKETLLEAVLKAVKPADDTEERASRRDFATLGERSQVPNPKPKRARATRGSIFPKTRLPKSSRAYNKGTRERIEQLLGQRNAFKAEAEVTQTLRNFLVTNDIAREDFQLTLDLAAAMRRGDFKSFLEGVGPYVQLATQALGITLPPDLQGEVTAGARDVRRGGSNVARQVREGSRRATRDARHAGGGHSVRPPRTTSNISPAPSSKR